MFSFPKLQRAARKFFVVIVKVLFIDYHEVPIPLSRSEAATLK